MITCEQCDKRHLLKETLQRSLVASKTSIALWTITRRCYLKCIGVPSRDTAICCMFSYMGIFDVDLFVCFRILGTFDVIN